MQLIVECDGGSRGNPGPAGYGAVVLTDDGIVLAERAGFLGYTTNNVAEYTGLIVGLTAAYQIAPAATIIVRADSKLVCEQMSGKWKIKNGDLIALAHKAAQAFPAESVTYEWVPREQNYRADALANEAMNSRESEIARDYPNSLTAEHIEPLAPKVHQPNPITQNPDGATKHSLMPIPSAFLGLDNADCLTLALVRHGVTAHTIDGRLAGGDTPGAPLSPLGEQMAEAAANLLADLPLIWPDLAPIPYLLASPMIRTQQTAKRIGDKLRITPVIDPRLHEIYFGAWHELTVSEVEAKWPGEFHRMRFEGTFAPPGGESYADTARRVSEVIADLLKSHLGQTVGIIGHAAMIRAIIGPIIDLPVAKWSQIRIPPCSLSIVRIWPTANDCEGVTELTALGVPCTLSTGR